MPSPAVQAWKDQLRANAGYGDNPGEDLGNPAMPDGWYPGKVYSNILGDVRDYFTDWRGDLIAQEQNDLARQTLEHQMNMDINGTQIRAEDYAGAGLSKYALAGGASSGQGSSAQAPQLAKPGRAQAMRQGLGQMLEFGAQLAHISRTQAETDMIKAKVPGETANSQYLQQTLADRIQQMDIKTTNDRYAQWLNQTNTTASMAEAQLRYYEAKIEQAWRLHQNDPNATSIQSIQTWDSANKQTTYQGQGSWPEIRLESEWIDYKQMNNPSYREALAQQIVLATNTYNLEESSELGVRTNQTGSMNMLIEGLQEAFKTMGLDWLKLGGRRD